MVIIEKDEPRKMPSLKLKSEKSLNEGMEKKTEIIEHLECRSRVIILRSKKEQDGESKLVKVILERP